MAPPVADLLKSNDQASEIRTCFCRHQLPILLHIGGVLLYSRLLPLGEPAEKVAILLEAHITTTSDGSPVTEVSDESAGVF